MALHGRSAMSSAARPSHGVVCIGASDPSSPKDLSLPPQEPDRTHALSFYVTCVLTSSHSCAVVVLWVRAVYSDCLPLLPAARFELGHSSRFPQVFAKRARPPRPIKTRVLDHPSKCSQPWPVNTVSVVTIQRAGDHHASALSASPGHHRLPSLPAVHCTDHVLLDECEALSKEPPLQDESRRSSSEFAECACIRTISGFLKCVVARSATMLIPLA